MLIKEFFGALDYVAPINLSYKCIEKGSYDNSGILINSTGEVNRVLFSLDLSKKAIELAKKLKCDTIVTHHPAIYAPVKSLDINGQNSEVLLAVKNGLNVISMHLNLDVCKTGIDFYLGVAIANGEQEILDKFSNDEGYGRVTRLFANFDCLIKNLKKNLKTNKILVYGNRRNLNKLNQIKIASFCGAGGSDLLNALNQKGKEIDLFISSDLPHHVIKEVVEMEKGLVIIPHYASENYGFNKYFELIKSSLCDKIHAYYFEDKRFL